MQEEIDNGGESMAQGKKKKERVQEERVGEKLMLPNPMAENNNTSCYSFLSTSSATVWWGTC